METVPVDVVRRARNLARSLLAEALPERWAHTQGVARRVRTLSPILGGQTRVVEAAAWLHDIGYAPALAITGFHPLDGARYLREDHPTQAGDSQVAALPLAAGHHGPLAPLAEEVIGLVAHHSCAIFEAEERGLRDVLEVEFPLDAVDADLLSALTYADLTTSPTGQTVSVEERLAEILVRYPPADPVHRAIARADTLARTQCRGVKESLKAAQMEGDGYPDIPPMHISR